MKSFTEIWSWVVKHIDKVAHFLIPYAIGTTGGLFGLMVIPVAMSLGLIFGKEFWDLSRHKGFSGTDVVAGFLGMFVALVVVAFSRVPA